MVDMLEKKNTSSAYLIPLILAYTFMQKFQELDGNPVYKILNEILLPGLDMFMLQKHSPLLQKFDRFVHQIKTFSLVREYHPKNVKTVVEHTVLTMSHFYLVFGLLVVGECLATFVFLFEISWNKCLCRWIRKNYFGKR